MPSADPIYFSIIEFGNISIYTNQFYLNKPFWHLQVCKPCKQALYIRLLLSHKVAKKKLSHPGEVQMNSSFALHYL